MTCPRGGHAGRSLRIGANARFGNVRCDKLQVILTASADCFSKENRVPSQPAARPQGPRAPMGRPCIGEGVIPDIAGLSGDVRHGLALPRFGHAMIRGDGA